jgi:hypothetical protein
MPGEFAPVCVAWLPSLIIQLLTITLDQLRGGGQLLRSNFRILREYSANEFYV